MRRGGRSGKRSTATWRRPCCSPAALRCGFAPPRWTYLLRPLVRTRTHRMYPILTVGCMANNLLPLRAGELVRAHLVRERYGVRGMAVLGTIALERAVRWRHPCRAAVCGGGVCSSGRRSAAARPDHGGAVPAGDRPGAPRRLVGDGERTAGAPGAFAPSPSAERARGELGRLVPHRAAGRPFALRAGADRRFIAGDLVHRCPGLWPDRPRLRDRAGVRHLPARRRRGQPLAHHPVVTGRHRPVRVPSPGRRWSSPG